MENQIQNINGKTGQEPSTVQLKKTRRYTPVQKVYQKILDELSQQNLPPGTRLQPMRELARMYQVSYLTVQRAIKRLQNEGKIVARPGDGMYIAGEEIGLVGVSEQEIPITKNIVRIAQGPKAIGIVMPFWVSRHGGKAIHEMIKGILQRCDHHEWRVELIHNSGFEACEADFADKIVRKELDGVVWLQPIPSHQMNLMRLMDKGLKVVATGRRLPHIPLKVVRINHADMGEKIAAFCVEKNLRYVTIISSHLEGFYGDAFSGDIVDILRKSFQRYDIEIPDDRILQTHLHYLPEHKQVTEAFLLRHPQVDAIITIRDDLYNIMSHVVRAKLGRNPQEICVLPVSTDFHSVDEFGNFQIAKILWPLENMGREVIRYFEQEWFGQSQNGEYDLTVTLVPPTT
jgi:DNA-binding LacI/PurR family transcriptional regulator